VAPTAGLAQPAIADVRVWSYVGLRRSCELSYAPVSRSGVYNAYVRRMRCEIYLATQVYDASLATCIPQSRYTTFLRARSCPHEACAWGIRNCCTPRNLRRHLPTTSDSDSESEPAAREVVRSGQFSSGQVRSGQVRSGQVRSGQVESGQVRVTGRSGPVTQVRSDLVYKLQRATRQLMLLARTRTRRPGPNITVAKKPGLGPGPPGRAATRALPGCARLLGQTATCDLRAGARRGRRAREPERPGAPPTGFHRQ
jgi:hypothetical protein